MPRPGPMQHRAGRIDAQVLMNNDRGDVLMEALGGLVVLSPVG